MVLRTHDGRETRGLMIAHARREAVASRSIPRGQRGSASWWRERRRSPARASAGACTLIARPPSACLSSRPPALGHRAAVDGWVLRVGTLCCAKSGRGCVLITYKEKKFFFFYKLQKKERDVSLSCVFVKTLSKWSHKRIGEIFKFTWKSRRINKKSMIFYLFFIVIEKDK